MRTIKFDIILWDGFNKETVTHYSIEEAVKEDFIQFKGDAIIPTDDSVIIRQFTGLLDKNGKEIYEGDVLDYEGNKGRRSRSSKREPFDNYYVVHFKNGNFCVKGFNGDFPVNPNLNIRSNWEIIGNIHE